MTQTFTENVQVNGSADVTQLQVKGHTTQTQPLQAWQDSGGNTLARVTPDGRLQQGNLGLGTPAALVEANDSITLPSSKPKRAWHALGRISGALTDAIAWVVHELELLGSGGTSGIHTALRAKLTHNNTGSATSAELRAGDFQTVNQSGTSGARVGQIKGLRSAASNGPNAYLNKAVGVEATITNDAGGNVTDAVAFDVAMPSNAGTLANLYGVRVPTFSGLAGVSTDFASAQFEDDVELKLQSAMPVKNPPANFIKMYTRLVGGVPKLYGKDSAGVERELGGGGSLQNADLVQVENFTQATTSPLTIFTPPANAILKKVLVQVNTAALGGSPTLSVGIVGNTARDMATTENDLKTVGVYEVTPMTAVGASPAAVIATLVPSGQTFSGSVYVVYSNPN